MQGHRRPNIRLRSEGQENYVQNIEYLNSVPGKMHDTLSDIQTNNIGPGLKKKDPMRDKRITYGWLGSKGQRRNIE